MSITTMCQRTKAQITAADITHMAMKTQLLKANVTATLSGELVSSGPCTQGDHPKANGSTGRI